jgi:bifunctional non-homologous end joining protein LigD
MTTIQPLQDITLYYREGASDKVYQVSLVENEEGFVVHYAYGRRGNTLTTGIKTKHPVSRKSAEKVFRQLVKSKQAKGYQPGTAGTPYQPSPHEQQDTGIRCQLLNPITEDELHDLLANSTHGLQEKHDGRRLLVRKRGGEITGINRRGLVIALPETIRQAVSQLPGDLLLDGEAIGDHYHPFDLLEEGGDDIRRQRYLERYSQLASLLPEDDPFLRLVGIAIGPREKYECYHDLRVEGHEGVVLKDLNAAHSPGRPHSGGSQLKHKFYHTASFLVLKHNRKRSVTLGLHASRPTGKATKPKATGNVTIPPNQAIPAVGSIVEIRYLYAFPESGAIYQPTYLAPRSDIPPSDCTTSQLHYKPTTV